MTGGEMNAPIRKIAALSAMVAGMLVLTACASAFAPETDPSSPVAPRVQALVEAHREYPRWENFPRQSEPAPEPAVIASSVNALNVTSDTLAADVARIEWTLTEDPAAFAEATRARVEAVPVTPTSAQTQAEIETFARQTRERGRAPPPVDRR
jgi:hypothetical protein